MGTDLTASTTPFTPPSTEDDRLSWLRLIRSRRVGPATFRRLLADHGSAAAALDALPGIARAAGLTDYTPCSAAAARAECAAGQRAGLQMLCLGAPDYPLELADLTDAPPVLWRRGDAAHLARPMVALVGSRNASSLGQRMAARLARDLGAAGLVVVSGLARGIDAAAHAAALDRGTVAVMAGGADTTYPAENAALAAQLAARGALLSEQPPGLAPQARHFPIRNRIISGIALGVVVVEAAQHSGSLITARNALDQGREVMAVPGHPVDPRAAGCNLLLRDGSALIRHAEDVLEALEQPLARARARRDRTSVPSLPPPPAPAMAPRSQDEIRALHRGILDRLGPAPLAEDQLARDLALSPARLAPELLALELEGRIARHPGNLLTRTAGYH